MKKLYLFFFVLVFALPCQIFSYWPETTHAGLTQEMIAMYNEWVKQNFSSQDDREKMLITDVYRSNVISGSIEEDNPSIRALNHFYDPIRKIGVEGYRTARQWALDGNLVGNQYSWPKIIKYYVEGDKDKAFEGLGHILHLVEDMTVPDHTRNDVHMDGSPYETWAGESKDKDVLKNFYKKIGEPHFFENIGDVMDFLANYSNKNFFSKDTIKDEAYTDTGPKITFYKNDYAYGIDSFSKELALLSIAKEDKNGSKWLTIQTDEDDSVLSSYFDRLAPQAVKAGAGVIRLFMEEVTKKENEISKAREEYGWFGKLWNSVTLIKDKILYLPLLAYQTTRDGILPMLGFQTVKVANYAGQIAEETEKKLQDLESGIKQIIYQAPSHIIENAEEAVESVTPVEQVTGPAFAIGNILGGLSGGSNGSKKSDNGDTTLISTTTEEAVVSPPTISSFAVAECAGSIVVSGCLVSNTVLNLSWVVPSDSSPVSYFSLNLNGRESTTTSSSVSVSVDDNSDYFFEVSAVSAGGASATSTQNVSVYSAPVVINEIAWAGTFADSHDEWIELYNPTPYSINLNGWTLYASTTGPDIDLSGVISAKSFYLLERKDDGTISDTTADLLYGNDANEWSLSNSGEYLILKDANGNIIDATPDTVSWVAGSNEDKYSMERIDHRISGTVVENWKDNLKLVKNSKDFSGNFVYGTPSKKNSVSYLVNKGEDIAGDVVLSKNNNPYIINRSDFLVFDTGTLTIEPGVILKFVGDEDDSGLLNVFGKLFVRGEQADPVILTSFHDNSIGGVLDAEYPDTVEDEYRGGIYMYENSVGSVFENLTMRYSSDGLYFDNVPSVAVENFRGEGSRSGITFYGGSGDVSDSYFENIYNNAVAVYGGANVTTKNSDFKNILDGFAFLVVNSIGTCDDCVIDGGGGVALGPEPMIAPMFVDPGFSGGTKIKSVSTGYIEELYLKNSVLRNSSGVKLRGNSSDTSQLSYASINNTDIANSQASGVVAEGNAVVNIENSKIENSNYSGIYSYGSSWDEYSLGINITRSNILNNFENGIFVDNPWANVTVSDSNIVGNLVGIENKDSPEISATRVWWGHDSGPYSSVNNSSALGDEVLGGVSFSPWLVGPFETNPDTALLSGFARTIVEDFSLDIDSGAKDDEIKEHEINDDEQFPEIVENITEDTNDTPIDEKPVAEIEMPVGDNTDFGLEVLENKEENSPQDTSESSDQNASENQ